jgi:hypothetical protein
MLLDIGRSFSWDPIVRGMAYDEVINVTYVFLNVPLTHSANRTTTAAGPAMTMEAGFSIIACTAFSVKG